MTGSIVPNYTESIKFLQRFHPRSTWTLVAIDPAKRGIETASFQPEDHETAKLWLEDQGTRKCRNLYFTVNQVTRMLDTKPKREHIKAMCWLHVDLDPRAGENIDEERTRILNLLRNPPGAIPPPSVITFSGGGYQGFWRLRVPVSLDGTVEAFEDAKLYNKQMEIVLGGDNCHNVDRIMRIPGTLNRPDRKKAQKGRTIALASTIEWSDAVYDLERFTKAPEVQGRSAPGFAGNSVTVSGNIQRFSSVDDIRELQGSRWNQTRVIICQGLDPDDPDKFGASRSEWLFSVCCEMVRAGCDDDTIYSVITDPDFAISGSVLDKGSGVEQYAIRQIERAHEEAIEPTLRELNEKHAVIGSVGGKCRILSEEFDPALGRPQIRYQTQSDFMLRYKNRVIDFQTGANGKMSSKPAALWWLEHPMRREYETVVFAPGLQTPGCYNMWRGFSFDAIPDGSCDLYLEHVKNNICRSDEAVYNYLIRWMANAVQKPAEPAQVAIALRGSQGTGKGVFAQTFGKLFGRHFLQVVDSKHLVGSFNSHMRDCVVMFADEAFAAHDKRAESILKTIVTEAVIITEQKGVDAEATPNYIHLIMASNEQWVLPAGPFERRFCVLDVSDDARQNGAYFSAVAKQMEEGGYEALLHFLLTLDLSEFNVRDFPRTGALGEQQEYTLSADEEWWYDKLQQGELIDGQDWPDWVHCSELLYDYIEFHRRSGLRGRATSHRLAKLLESVTAGGVERIQQQPNEPVQVLQKDGHYKEVARPYAYRMPSLPACIRAWKAKGLPWRDSGKPTKRVPMPYEEKH